MARVGKGLTAVIRQDGLAAAHRYSAFLPVKGTTSSGCVITVDRMLGLLAHTMGDQDATIDHFDDAQSFCRKGGYRPEVAWTCCDYADMLLDPSASPTPSRLSNSGRSSGQAVSEDRAKAMSLPDESLAISSELGMRPLMERVLSRREILSA